MTPRRAFWILAISSALLLLAPLRTGDLTGYDDALYAQEAKTILHTGDWINVQVNGYPAMEHPPGFVWMQAAMFSIFGISDTNARLPSAVCGLGTILLVYWLARRLLRDELAAVVAMFVMAGSVYFVKYASHGMTDVPFTFVFLCAICAWLLAQERAAWYFAVAFFTAYALFTRGVVGLALPMILMVLGISERESTRWRYALPALAVAFLPVAAWYGHLIRVHGHVFWEVQGNFVMSKVNGELTQPWRRYTGAFEYAWMLMKSYWPWLPFLAIGIVTTIRQRDRRLHVLLIWSAIMFAVCAAGGSRVLRYLLPAYPAFSILAAVGLMQAIPVRYLLTGLNWLVPAGAVVCAGIALFPPTVLHAAEIRPIATALQSTTASDERIAFYDGGQPRFDEANQLQWYGDRNFYVLLKREDFENALRGPLSRVFIVDIKTYQEYGSAFRDYEVVVQSGHLVCLRNPGILAGNLARQILIK